jgi:glyoxylase-like metal-dependent hydrolase (beta-lactamase superfamily II)
MDQSIHDRISTVNVWWEDLKFHIPVYLVKGKENALIDAGPPQRTPGGLARALEPFGVGIADIDQVLLTHGHLDHVGGLPEIKAAGRAKVVIGMDDASYLSDHSRAYDEFYSIGTRLLSGKEDLREEKAGFLSGAGPEFLPDRVVVDGDTVMLGNGVDLKVINLPGHSNGSVGYYWEEEGILIAGDSIPGLSGPDGSLPIILDLPKYEQSIDRILAMPLKTLVFTHGYRALRMPPSTIRRGKEIEEYLRDSRQVAARLTELLKQKAAGWADRPFVELVDEVIAGMPPEMRFVPLARQVSPHFTVTTVYNGMLRFDERR